MDLINKNELKAIVDQNKKAQKFDQEIMESFLKLSEEDILFLLYDNMLSMNKFNKGVFKDVPKVIGSTVKNSPYEKVIIAYLEYLNKKSNECEGLDKIQYLKSIQVFVNWLNNEVFVRSK